MFNPQNKNKCLKDICNCTPVIIGPTGPTGPQGPTTITIGTTTTTEPETSAKVVNSGTKENVNLETLGFENIDTRKFQAIITPIEIAGERLGTLFIYKCNEQYDIDDIILCEYGTTVVGLEMLRAVNEESAEESRKVAVVKSAVSTLSFSEMEAITHIFDELNGMEGILVASKIADRVGITRSVIVNALRKFESAGVIESRSSGMKGTYIKVLNDAVFDEIEELKRQNGRN